MNQHVALDVTLATSTPERKVEAYLLALCSFILVVAFFAIAALVSDRSLTPRSADRGVSTIRDVPMRQ
jgi:hypothetical protein